MSEPMAYASADVDSHWKANANTITPSNATMAEQMISTIAKYCVQNVTALYLSVDRGTWPRPAGSNE
jgi:hypothetical protein